MAKDFLNLSPEEKSFVSYISAISTIDEDTVKKVLRAILKGISIEQFVESNNVYIPYICSLIISSHEKITEKGVKTIVELEAIPSKHLIEEIKKINEGEIPPTQNYVRQNIYGDLEKTVKD